MIRLFAIYLIYLAIRDFFTREVSYFDLLLFFSFVAYKTYLLSFILSVIFVIISLIWIILEIRSDKEELLFPMGIIDFFYLFFIFISSLHNFSIYYLYGSLGTLILTMWYRYKKKEQYVPYLFVLLPLGLAALFS